MSKKDATKSKINALIATMVVFLTSLLAVIGYAFVHRRELNVVDACFMIGGLVVLIVSFCVSVLWIKKEIKRLEKIK